TVLAACLLLLAGCSSNAGGDTSAAAVPKSHVQVDTPQLRAAKRAAGVEPCRPGSSSSDLPDLSLACLGGGPDVRLSRLQGPLVINLFAQWCGPCRSEMPYYQQLHEKAKGSVRVVGVDYLDTRPDMALRLVKDTGVTYPLLADPDGRLRADFGIRGLPGLVLVKPDGSVDVQFRVVRSYAELRGLVEKGLGVRVPA
ncbi:MAG: TlpA family protein disulfide reductase, partial [Nocardioidaceae bacterium]|nr:TlpA family protein disulfide reductase [Nocardioidaceae bacterium]